MTFAYAPPTRRDKPLLLAVGFDAPATGLARVMNSILEPLADDFDIHLIAIGRKEPTKTGRITTHPCNLRGGDVFGAYQSKDFVERFRPELVLLLNDVWIMAKYARALANRPSRTKVVSYLPLDGGIPDESLVEPLAAFDRLVAYTHFARRELERAAGRGGSLIPNIEVIPHGVDTSVFHPLPEEKRLASRKALLPEGSDPYDSFIVLNANRPQPRKRIDITLEGFARFARGKPPNVALCLHHAISTEGERAETSRLADSLAISERLTTSHESLSDAKLNELYNACDIGMNTSMGEGWGLVSFEQAAAGAAQIVPHHSACAELWKDAAELLEPEETLTPSFSLLEMEAVSPRGVAASLERLYADREYRKTMSRAAYDNATKPEYRWSHISHRWRRLLDEASKTRKPSA